MKANKIMCGVIMAAIVFLLITNVNITVPSFIRDTGNNERVDDNRPYFDIDVLPLDKKKHHKEKQKFIHGVPTPQHTLPGVPTPQHTLPGVPTPTKKVNLTPHELN